MDEKFKLEEIREDKTKNIKQTLVQSANITEQLQESIVDSSVSLI
jgi:hypothetical protein